MTDKDEEILRNHIRFCMRSSFHWVVFIGIGFMLFSLIPASFVPSVQKHHTHKNLMEFIGIQKVSGITALFMLLLYLLLLIKFRVWQLRKDLISKKIISKHIFIKEIKTRQYPFGIETIRIIPQKALPEIPMILYFNHGHHPPLNDITKAEIHFGKHSHYPLSIKKMEISTDDALVF